MNTKSFAMGQLVIIILTVVSFMLIATVVSRAFSNKDDAAAEALCQESIAWRAATVLNINTDEKSKNLDIDVVKGKLKPIPTLCKTIDKKIDGDQRKIKEQLANQMARCWWMFNEGRYDEILHGSKVVPALISNLDEANNECFVCYATIINEDKFDDKKESIKSEEFLNYLATTNYTKVPDKTYLDYIQSFGGPGGVQILTNIEPRHAYGITFMAKNIDNVESTWLGWFGKTISGTAGGAATVWAAGTALSACTLATAGVCLLGVAVLGGTTAVITYSAASDLEVLVNRAYSSTERDISIVSIDTLDRAQAHCFKKDIAEK